LTIFSSSLKYEGMPFLAFLLILVISTPCFSQTSKDLIKARGISKKCETVRAEIRSTNDAIDFIEKTYRKKDPDYADFSIRQQQQFLQRLNEEWTSAECAKPPPEPEKIGRLSPHPNESPDQVWQVGDRRWTVEEEHRFEKWVEETMTEDFFIRYEIPTDCADAVYAIRWIYARIAQLPVAATTRDGRRIGHWSTDWKHLPTHPEWDKDERFRATLRYLLPKTWTGTLPFDTYPVRITPDSVRPGTLFLVTESHTGIIGHVFFDGSHAHPLQAWESALPVKVQKLSLRYFFSTRPESKSRAGLVKFRWPISENGEWKYLPVEEQPFYSEEQYTSGFCEGSAGFVEAVARRIDQTTYAPMEKLVKVMGTITRLVRERIPIVLAGYQQCGNGDCAEASELWEIHNTAGRDGMIVSLMDHLSQIIELNHLDQERVKEMMEAVPIDISENRSATLYHVYQNHLWLSPHPGDSIEARWGLKKCEAIHAQTRTANDSVAFIERTYRKKDPHYADFTIRTQQQLLARLSGEWTKSECRESLLTPEKEVRRSSPPGVLIKAHRGSKRCEQIHTEIRIANNSIAFIEKTYRGRDPGYADFTIQTQQQLLERLSEEWTDAECRKPSPTPEKKVELPPPPVVPIKAHRGSKRCEQIHTEIRTAHDSIAFVEKTYREKDPDYADFTVRAQQQLLERLNEEWVESKCREPSPRPEKKARK
jgi:hypothetical protein